MDSYIGNRPISEVAGIRREFIATAGQTTFTVSYAVGYVDVFKNGLKLPSSAFTATNGSTVVLAQACVSGDVVAVIAWAKGAMLPAEEFAPIGRTRKNLLINGGMQVWQRGASGPAPLNVFTYTADRWCVDAAGAALNWSQGQSPVNALRSNGSLALLGAAGNTGFGIHQRIEGGTTWPLAGKKLTLSVKLFSSSARTFKAYIGHANSLDDFSGRTLLESKDIAVHPGGYTWITAAVTFDAAMPAQCVYGLYVSIGSTALVAGAAAAIADAQLEIGEEATDFEILPIGETQTLCERYYQFVPFSMGFNATVANQTLMQSVPYRTRMRAIPVGGPLIVDPETTPSAALNGSNVFVGPTTTHIRSQLTANGVGYCTVGGYGSWLSAEL